MQLMACAVIAQKYAARTEPAGVPLEAGAL